MSKKKATCDNCKWFTEKCSRKAGRSSTPKMAWDAKVLGICKRNAPCGPSVNIHSMLGFHGGMLMPTVIGGFASSNGFAVVDSEDSCGQYEEAV